METAKKQIFNLLFLLFFGALCAFALVAYMLYNYGPTGRYLTQNVLLSPEGINILTYQELSPHSGKLTKYVFERVEMSYMGKDNKETVVGLSLEQYKKIYNWIKQQESLQHPSADIEALFYSQPPARVMIKVKPEMTADVPSSKVIFQEVQFAKDSRYYRVQLPEKNMRSGPWVYFEYPDVYQLVIQTLSK